MLFAGDCGSGERKEAGVEVSDETGLNRKTTDGGGWGGTLEG